MSSMSSVIKQHNYKVSSTTENEDQLCNCRNKENCPLDGRCLQTCIVYKADVITNKDSHLYFGASDGEFKSRYNNYTNSFCHRYHKQDTELSKHIWKLFIHSFIHSFIFIHSFMYIHTPTSVVCFASAQLHGVSFFENLKEVDNIFYLLK